MRFGWFYSTSASRTRSGRRSGRLRPRSAARRRRCGTGCSRWRATPADVPACLLAYNVPSMSRAEREAAAWDHLYHGQQRTRAYKFYAASAAARQHQWRLIADDCPGRRVLDYGCGPGSRAVEMARLGATVVGVDISGEAIRIAQLRAGAKDNLTFAQMDAEAMSFPNDQFDLVCGTAILHHLNVHAASREIVRVLKPGGRAVFLEPLGHNVLINLYRRLTPAMRTVDEHPLCMTDIEAISDNFADVHLYHYVLTALIGVPFRKLPGSEARFNALHAIDRMLFRLPALRWQAWQLIIDGRA